MSEAACDERVPFRAVQGRAHASGWEHDEETRSSLAHLHHDLPQLLPLVQTLECRSCLLERKYLIHNWPQLARAQQPYDLPVLGVVPHRRTQDAPAIPEQPAQVRSEERRVGKECGDWW